MKRLFTVLLFSLWAQCTFADDYDIILSRVLPDVVNINSIVSDASTENVLKLRDSVNTPSVGLTKPYFSDINYSIKYGLTGFRTLFHLRRIQDLARTYISDKNSVGGVNKYKNRPRVLSAIVGALEYYRLNQSTLDSLGNFTYKFIDYPREYTAALVMLRNALTIQQLQLYFAMIPNHTDDAKVTNYVGQNLPYTGANLMQNALCVFRRGVILKNATDLNNSIKAFSTMFDKNADDDGVMVDFAFYAHHQLYNGLYGAGNESIVIDYCITYVKGTAFYNTSAISKMGDYVLYGQYWFQYRKAVDFQIMGRQYIRIGTEHGQLVAPWVLDTLAVYDKARASQYNAFKNHMVNGAAYTNIGHKQFYTANMNVQRGANYYMSVKFPSTRFFSNECGNGQGLKEYYLALGGTYIMADGNEFMQPDRDINLRPIKGEAIPILNYSLIPGTTSIYSSTGDVPTIGKIAEITADKSVFNKQKGTNTFGGGLNAAGGLNLGKGGIAAYIQDQLDITDNGGNAYPKVKYTDQLVKAKKSYFFIGDAMICMGASISSTDNNIVTTVNQHLTSGKVTLQNSGTTSIFSSAQQTFTNTLNWAHHDQIGYIFPQKQNIVVKNNIQTGFFNTGDHVGPANSGDIQAADSMFSVWIDHGNTPTDKEYQYIVIPNISAADLATRYSSLANEFSEIINNDTIQAVRSIKNNTYAAVFYKTGTCDFGDGFSIYVDKAALVYIEKNINGYVVSVSDPYYIDNNSIKVRINKLLTGTNAIAYTYTTIITAAMPTGDYVGSTITNQYNYKQATITVNGQTTFCNGEKSVLTASTGSSYIWYKGATQVGTSQTYTATTSGSYTVQVKYADNTTSTSIATVITVNALPTATITTSGATTFCNGGNVNLTSSTGTSYVWRNRTTTVASTASYIAKTAGNYTVIVTNASGCKDTSAATVVTVNALPIATVTASGATTFCNGGSVNLTSSTGTSYVWRNGATTVGTTASYLAKTSGNYTVIVTNASGCKDTSTVTVVTVNALPTATITASGATTFCNGGSVNLTSSTGTSYVWRNGTTTVATTASYLAKTAGSFTVIITNASGCKDTSAATVVTVNALPTPTITSNTPLTFCSGGNVLLTSSVGSTYKWLNGNTILNITTSTYSATTSGSYKVIVTNSNGCSDTSAAKTVSVTTPTKWYEDKDGDGKGDNNIITLACSQPVGYVAVGGDNCPLDANKLSAGNCGCGKTEQSCIDCSGKINGTAFIDSCGKCSGGTTGVIAELDKSKCVTLIEPNIDKIDKIDKIDNLTVNPNPSAHDFKIYLEELTEVKLISSEGSILFKDTIKGEFKFGENLKSGLYILILHSNKIDQTIKLLKK